MNIIIKNITIKIYNVNDNEDQNQEESEEKQKKYIKQLIRKQTIYNNCNSFIKCVILTKEFDIIYKKLSSYYKVIINPSINVNIPNFGFCD